MLQSCANPSQLTTDYKVVRKEGVEPSHLSALDPKSSVSTNFTTCAFKNLASPRGNAPRLLVLETKAKTS